MSGNEMRELFLSISLLALSACNCSDDTETADIVESPITWEDCSYEMNDHPCDFTLKDQDGKDWTLYDHFGDVIVLDFSTEWCGYCRIAAQEVEAIQTAYGGQDLTYVTILVEDQYGNPADVVDASEWATT